jgi:hypothetical protein
VTNPLDVMEDLLDDDPFIRAYPSFAAYVNVWDEDGGVDAWSAPSTLLYDFYAEKLPVDQALHMWFTYTQRGADG